MKRLTTECGETELIPTEGSGFAVYVRIASEGDEAVGISGVLLCRKGINAFPEFAEGFNLDCSRVIPGLAPERYQVRVDMLLSHKGRLLYGDGRSEFALASGKSVRFVLPLPFAGVGYFLGGSPEDVFVTVKSLSCEKHSMEVPGLQETIRRSLAQHSHQGSPYNAKLSVVVPMKEPPSQEELERVKGTTNTKPVRPMPNT